MGRVPVKAWITKHALTQGIFCVDAEICHDISDKMISVKSKEGFWDQTIHKPDWHENKDEAIAKAEDMRKKKIVSLKKQIKKLEELKF
jgi:hypothetical protein